MVALLPLGGCKTGVASSPQALLDRYFSSAQKQDYSASYDCYYAAYKAKVNRAEYIKRRKADPSVLKDYKVLSAVQAGDSAQAQVQLTFAPAGKLKATPVVINVTEQMIKENGDWKIKVW